MGADERPFVFVERARLPEDGVRDRNLADVVELGRLPNRRELILGHAELTRDRLRHLGDVSDVGAELGVAFGEGAQQNVRALPARRHPPGVLGVVHALVGQQQRLVRRRDLGQQHDRAVRASDRERVAVLAQRLDRGGACGVGVRPRDEDAELVAAQPIGLARLGDRVGEPPAEAREQRIAGLMAERVVVDLESVQIEERQSHSRHGHGLVEVGEQAAAVAELGEHIGRPRQCGAAPVSRAFPAGRPRSAAR